MFNAELENLKGSSRNYTVAEIEEIIKAIPGGEEILGSAPGGIHFDSAKGAYYNPRTRSIHLNKTIAPTLRAAVGIVGHELGHSLAHQKGYFQGSLKMSRSQYIQTSLNNEGYAEMMSGLIRLDLRKAGYGGLIQTRGITSSVVKWGVSYDSAITKLADWVGRQRTSTTGENYKDYYGGFWDKYNN